MPPGWLSPLPPILGGASTDCMELAVLSHPVLSLQSWEDEVSRASGRGQPLQREAPLLSRRRDSPAGGKHPGAQMQWGIQALVLRHLGLKESPPTPHLPSRLRRSLGTPGWVNTETC